MAETKKIILKVNCALSSPKIPADEPEIITEWHIGRIVLALGLLLGLLITGVMVINNHGFFTSKSAPVEIDPNTASIATDSSKIATGETGLPAGSPLFLNPAVNFRKAIKMLSEQTTKNNKAETAENAKVNKKRKSKSE